MINKKYDQIDRKITQWMKVHGVHTLRYTLGILFIWFGILKPLGLSPAQGLIANTVYWFSPTWFVPFLGWWEVLIGLCFLRKSLLRLGIFLLALQMVGTFLPFIVLPGVVFGAKPYALTLEGQYIVKNIVIIAAAIVIGSHVRD